MNVVYPKSRRRAAQGGFRFSWTYPTAEPRIIKHKARKCEAVRRNGDREKVAVKVTVPAYEQIVMPSAARMFKNGR